MKIKKMIAAKECFPVFQRFLCCRAQFIVSDQDVTSAKLITALDY